MRVCPGCRTLYEQHVLVCPKDGLYLLDRSPSSGSLPDKAIPGGDDEDLDTAVQSGLMIGEYQVERLIAEGGMGTIYAGIHPLIRKRVAIKVLHKRYAQDPKAIARFVMEARSVNEIGHHNIVDIFSIGELDDQRNYLVMEYLDGLPLHEVLRKAPRLTPGEVRPIYEQLCDALRAAHAKGFVHRDLKPDNIIVLRRPPHPFIKILDFGLAKLRGSLTSSNTEVGMVLGTPEYMAPEQCRGGSVDARTDIYALGVLLYELLTGQRPFTDRSPLRVLAMQQRDEPQPPSRFAPLSAELEAIILRAMAKNPDERFQSAAELAAHLARAIPECAPWSITLDPLPPEHGQATPPAQKLEAHPPTIPPHSHAFAVLQPASISSELDDEEIDTLVGNDPQQAEAALNMLRVSPQAADLRKQQDSEQPPSLAVRNIRRGAQTAWAPAPFLGAPARNEIDEVGATALSESPQDPLEVTEEIKASAPTAASSRSDRHEERLPDTTPRAQVPTASRALAGEARGPSAAKAAPGGSPRRAPAESPVQLKRRVNPLASVGQTGEFLMNLGSKRPSTAPSTGSTAVSAGQPSRLGESKTHEEHLVEVQLDSAELMVDRPPSEPPTDETALPRRWLEAESGVYPVAPLAPAEERITSESAAASEPEDAPTAPLSRHDLQQALVAHEAAPHQPMGFLLESAEPPGLTPRPLLHPPSVEMRWPPDVTESIRRPAPPARWGRRFALLLLFLAALVGAAGVAWLVYHGLWDIFPR